MTTCGMMVRCRVGNSQLWYPTLGSRFSQIQVAMDAEPAQLIIQALRECGSFSEESLTQAATVCQALSDPTSVAQYLYNAQFFTLYQAGKFVKGRHTDLFFGKYFIQEKVGEGGMGRVYRAINLETKQVVALKIVRQALLKNSAVMQRYQREVNAVSALNHPNIVKLYEANEVQGRAYIAMEYVDGIDLARLVRRVGTPPDMGLPEPGEACEYARQVALGLNHAHESGFVHRDIKPSNIMVTGERALPISSHSAAVKILDMGLVRNIIDEEDGISSDLTRHGTVVGTPDYMSPEQGRNSSTVDGRADIYSLGCTLYFLLKGQQPFPTGYPLDKLIAHQIEPMPDLRQFRTDLHRDLIAIIEVMTGKKPEDRFNTAMEVAELLASFSSNPTIRSQAVDAEKFKQKAFEHVEIAASPESIAELPSHARVIREDETPYDGMPQAPVSGKRLRVVESGDSTPLADILDTMTPANSSDTLRPSSRSSTRLPRPAAKPIEVHAREPEPRTPPRRKSKPKPKEPIDMMPIWLIVGGVVFLALLFTAIMLR